MQDRLLPKPLMHRLPLQTAQAAAMAMGTVMAMGMAMAMAVPNLGIVQQLRQVGRRKSQELSGVIVQRSHLGISVIRSPGAIRNVAVMASHDIMGGCPNWPK